MKSWILLTLLAAGCAHPHEAEVVSSYSPRATIGQAFTADTTRLVPNAAATANAEGEKALAELLDSLFATVGEVRADKQIKKPDGTSVLELAVDLPAPGWALRARLQPKPEQMCFVLLEPVATKPDEHAVSAAPWSVHEAFEMVRRRAVALLPPKLPPMDAERFARQRAEAAEAAAHGIDPSLSPAEYVHVPRPINREGEEIPYYVPPIQQQQQQ
ncbi:MAG TPA: hypothetical protein VGL86_07445 [Polyangia bacterium]|jgi:hypothetical protein